MRRTLALLLTPLIRPRGGFRRFLAAHGQVDPTSLPLFSLLLLYFAALLLYAQVLRWTGHTRDAGLPGEAARALTAALPFFGSLGFLVAVLAWGLVLWAAGLLFGRRRPLGEWVGLAAICFLPEVVRVLLDAALTLAAVTLPGSAVVFWLWETVLIAFGFAAYAGRPLWAGGTVAALFAAVQVLLRQAA